MLGLSFGKDSRLLSAQDFKYLQFKSNRVNTKYLRAYYKKTLKPSDKTRVGFSVSKKVGNAVVRNRIKRILREKFRTSKFRSMGKDILIIVSPNLYKDFDNIPEAEAKLLGSFHWALSQISQDDV